MRLEDAARRVEDNEQVKRLGNFFLGSVFASLTEVSDVKEWTMLYYNPATRNVVDCMVNEKYVTVGEETPAINEMEKIDVTDAKISIDKAFKIINFAKKPVNILISLHKKEINKAKRTVWTIGMITQDMSVTSYDVDAITGKILKEETTSLIRRL